MQAITIKAEVRWADIDPNFHVLHSKYYDYCANARMVVLQNNGVTMQAIQKHNVGPILLREECVFKKELKFGDTIEVKIYLKSTDETFTRWSFVNEIWKNGDTLAAIITVDGAWMDTIKRKIVAPPEEFKNAFEALPKAQN
jgi:acyl-CoA thioester hydrolase